MESGKFKKSISWLEFAEKFRVTFMTEISKVNQRAMK